MSVVGVELVVDDECTSPASRPGLVAVSRCVPASSDDTLTPKSRRTTRDAVLLPARLPRHRTGWRAVGVVATLTALAMTLLGGAAISTATATGPCSPGVGAIVAFGSAASGAVAGDGPITLPDGTGGEVLQRDPAADRLQVLITRSPSARDLVGTSVWVDGSAISC